MKKNKYFKETKHVYYLSFRSEMDHSFYQKRKESQLAPLPYTPSRNLTLLATCLIQFSNI